MILEDIGDDNLLVVSPDRDQVRELTDSGINALTADPDNEESLRHAGLDRVRAVIAATDDDAADALTILTARQLNPDVQILAVATNRENMRKLKRAGANSVVSPAVIAAQQIVRSATGTGSDTGDSPDPGEWRPIR
jgi:voltage-gated potassium channel